MANAGSSFDTSTGFAEVGTSPRRRLRHSSCRWPRPVRLAVVYHRLPRQDPSRSRGLQAGCRARHLYRRQLRRRRTIYVAIGYAPTERW